MYMYVIYKSSMVNFSQSIAQCSQNEKFHHFATVATPTKID